MGRRKSAAQQRRTADFALARENYYRNRPASTITTVRKRETDSAVYASYSLKSGTDPQLFKVPVSDAALAFFGGSTNAAGLTALGLRTPASVTDPVAPKSRGFTPAMVSAMIGTSTPTASLSPWLTRVIKYSTATSRTTQAHYRAPISATSPTLTYDTIDARASALFTAISPRLGDLDYARFYLYPEKFSNSKV